MNKHDIVEDVRSSAGVTQGNAEVIVDLILGKITGAVARGEEVRLHGFGTFAPHTRPAGEGHNPRTGEKIQVPAKKTVKFKAAKGFTDQLVG
jgi:DNA-binding protein HU-beta